MKRTYNDKISLKANESLTRREQKVQMEKICDKKIEEYYNR